MKSSLHKIQCFFLIVLMIPLLMLTAWAEDPGARLYSLHFDIALQEDGSALITETREILFSGDREFTRLRAKLKNSESSPPKHPSIMSICPMTAPPLLLTD